MDNITKNRNLRLLDEAHERIRAVYYNMDDAKQSRFAKRADTIAVKILNLMNYIRQAS